MFDDHPMPSILLVEDDQMDVMNVQRELRRQNIEIPIVHAKNGRDALKMLRGEGDEAKIARPSLVMLDIDMPRMNGLELLEILRHNQAAWQLSGTRAVLLMEPITLRKLPRIFLTTFSAVAGNETSRYSRRKSWKSFWRCP